MVLERREMTCLPYNLLTVSRVQSREYGPQMQTLEETDSSLKNAENEVSRREAKREKNSL